MRMIWKGGGDEGPEELERFDVVVDSFSGDGSAADTNGVGFGIKDGETTGAKGGRSGLVGVSNDKALARDDEREYDGLSLPSQGNATDDGAENVGVSKAASDVGVSVIGVAGKGSEGATESSGR